MADGSRLDPLVARFQQSDLRRLLDRLVARLAAGKPLVGRIHLANPSDAERPSGRRLAGLGQWRPTSFG